MTCLACPPTSAQSVQLLLALLHTMSASSQCGSLHALAAQTTLSHKVIGGKRSMLCHCKPHANAQQCMRHLKMCNRRRLSCTQRLDCVHVEAAARSCCHLCCCILSAQKALCCGLLSLFQGVLFLHAQQASARSQPSQAFNVAKAAMCSSASCKRTQPTRELTDESSCASGHLCLVGACH